MQLLKPNVSSGIKRICNSSTAFSNWPKKCEVKSEWGRSHNEERYDLCSWTNTIRVTYLLTDLLTPWCRVLLKQLTRLQLVKKFLAFQGTRMLITALTSVRHLSLSWASPIQSIYPHPNSWRSILILSTHLRLGLPSRFLPSCLPNQKLYTPI